MIVSRDESRWIIQAKKTSMQFALVSWRGVGGMGFPHEASKLEQMCRGVLLLRRQGPGAWPVCSRMAG